jgi:hypothetical protein
MVTLEQFLRTGDLGPVRFGITAEAVTAALGPPPDESVRKKPLILKYGGLQLTLAAPGPGEARRVTHVGLYFRPPAEPLPDPVRPTDWLPTTATTESEFRGYLAQVGLPVGDAGEDRIVLPSGAQVSFADGRLHSIQFSHREPGPATRQVSVTLPEATLDSVRARARQANRSVAELCAEWITEKANSPN